MANDFALPEEMAQLRGSLGEIVDRFSARQLYASITLSSKRGQKISLQRGVETIAQGEPKQGMILTAFDGQMLHERAVGGFEIGSLQKSAREMLENLSLKSGLQVEMGPKRANNFVTPTVISPDSLSTKEKLERCQTLRKRVVDLDANLLDVRVQYIEEQETTVFRSQSADLGQQVHRLKMFLVPIVGDETGQRKYNVKIKSGACGWERLEFSQEELEQLIQETRALLKAERIEPGEYSVITAPEVSGVLCHESFGHGVEIDMFVKERAKSVDYLGKPVASPLVNIFDDPSLPGEPGSYFFDDEGWEASPTQILENGVFRRGISDLYSATITGTPRSANGRRQDFSRKAYARMSNTFFSAGDTPTSDLFAQVEDGVFLDKTLSGMEDPLGWGIQLTCHSGWEIKKGALTGRLFSPIGVSGYVPDVLKSITAVGDQVSFFGGTCGKGQKETASVGAGGPHLLLKARLG